MIGIRPPRDRYSETLDVKLLSGVSSFLVLLQRVIPVDLVRLAVKEVPVLEHFSLI